MQIIKDILYVVFCCIGLCPGLFGQCIFQVDETIPDSDTLEYPFEVFGLVNDMLSDPAQGVCGITLDFEHDYLGDLQIELISPSGQVVQLVGPVSTSINPTNLSRWQISFETCGSSVAPDAGFTSAFSNEQNWQILTTYTGSYYPHIGCLEDLNVGSANGTWVFRFIDAGNNAIGIIHSFEIQFCDNNGSDCSQCEANAGVFQDQNIIICEEEELNPAFLDPQYPSIPVPDPLKYAYLYFVHQNGMITYYGDLSSIGSFGPGDYSICGLSVAHTDTALLANFLDTASYNSAIQFIDSPTSSICANLTDNCISLSVEIPPEPVQTQRFLCKGDTISVGGENFYSEGIYEVQIPRVNGCDSVVTLNIQLNPTEAIINLPDLINCSNQEVELDGSSSIIPQNPTFQWYTIGGAIISNPNLDTVIISRRERYFLIASDGNCPDTAFVDVVGDESYPEVFTYDAIINCTNPVVLLDAQAFPHNVQYSWQFPNGNTIDDQQSIQTSTPGLYIVTAVNSEGCSSVDTFGVDIDTIKPPISADFVRKRCGNQSTTFQGLPSSSSYTYNWSGPNSFSSSNRVINTRDTGFYLLQITDQNGCSSFDSIFNDADYLIPDISAIATDSLGCGINGIQLFGNTMTFGGDFEWTGPNGFVSNEQNPIVFSAGQYTVSILGPNECTGSAITEVFQSDEIFPFTIYSDTISCKKDSALIGVSGTDLVLDWVGLIDSTSSDSFITVFEEGIYRVLMVDTISGCSQFAELEVVPDLRRPSFGFIRDTISCDNPFAKFTIVSTGPTIVDSIFWTFPDLSISTDSVIWTNLPGRHLVTVKDINGCIRNSSFIPVVDTLPPSLFTYAPVFGCIDSIQLLSIVLDTVTNLEWSGPNGFQSFENEPFVSDTGIYILEATAPNGCTSIIPTNVIPDMDPPEFSFQGGVFDCSLPNLQVASIPIDPVASYLWIQGSDTLSYDSILVISRPGTFIHEVTGLNNCIKIDTLIVDGPPFPTIFLQPEAITCAEPIAELVATNLNGPAEYEWLTTSQIILSTDSVLSVQSGDTLVLRVIGENGCVADTLVTLEFDTVAPIAIIQSLDEILCQDRIVRLDASTSNGDLLVYNWQTSNGEILSGQEESIVMVNDEGLYQLILIDDSNGCMDTSNFQLVESQNSIFDLSYTILVPICIGEENGSIEIDSIIGGSGSYVYAVDGLSQSNAIFQGLTSGTHLFSVIDSEGCRFDTTIFFATPTPLSIELGEPKTIYIGEAISLTAQIDVDSSLINRILWSPDIGMSDCLTCLTYEAVPLETTTFTATLEDTLGCFTSDNVIVRVIEKANIFLPNIFTPNDDGNNDVVRIFGGQGIAQFDFFRIFDRWGNQVFGVENFTSSDAPGIFWDGKLKNEKLMPALFTYVIKYRLVNGKEEITTGDILLIR